MATDAWAPPPLDGNGRRNPGLYPDPADATRRRWWDGSQWNEEVAPQVQKRRKRVSWWEIFAWWPGW